MVQAKQHFILILVVLILSGCASPMLGERKLEKRIIKITASKFLYHPSIIELEKDVPVIFELTSLDRLHGFSIPALGLRADVPPGQTVRVVLVPEKVGRYTFLCDIFCGGGHGEMNGVIVVK